MNKSENEMLQRSLTEVKKIIEENPATTHIILRREDEQIVDIPIAGVELTLKNHPTWRVEKGAVPDIETVGSKEELPVILPPKPSEETSSTDELSQTKTKKAKK